MITEQGIMENLKKLIGRTFKINEIYDEIVCAFEDYEYEGESYVQVTNDIEDEYYTTFQAYIDHEDADIYRIVTERDYVDINEYNYTVTEVY